MCSKHIDPSPSQGNDALAPIATGPEPTVIIVPNAALRSVKADIDADLRADPSEIVVRF